LLQTKFSPFPTLTTARLTLRAIERSDAPEIFAHRSDEIVNTYVENFRHARIEDTYAFIERMHREMAEGRTIMWVINEKGKSRFLGTVCFWNISKEDSRAETGYTLVSEHHGKGYMQEALAKIIAYGFSVMKLKIIDAYTHEKNEASIKLLKRNHFVQESVPMKSVSANRIYFSLANSGIG
jgi:ribosomal-protein-alanine N-acetyltransferase